MKKAVRVDVSDDHRYTLHKKTENRENNPQHYLEVFRNLSYAIANNGAHIINVKGV